MEPSFFSSSFLFLSCTNWTLLARRNRQFLHFVLNVFAVNDGSVDIWPFMEVPWLIVRYTASTEQCTSIGNEPR